MSQNFLPVGIMGTGAIARAIAKGIQKNKLPVRLVAAWDDNAEALAAFEKATHAEVGKTSLEEAVHLSRFFIEAAHPRVVARVLAATQKAGVPTLVMSVGGLVDLVDNLHQHPGPAVLVPSGAIGGLDALAAARLAGLEQVTLTTTKPPKGLEGAAYLVENKVVLRHEGAPQVVFEGTARQAIAAFPTNVNVCVALALAGNGPDATTVRVVSDPAATANTHEVYFRGGAGEYQFRFQNVPHPENPKTSFLAALSALHLLQRECERLKVG